MVDVAPLNYERWAVIVSPIQASDVRGVRPTYDARHIEQLIQLAPSLNNVDSRKKESLIEQTLKSPDVRQKFPKPKPEAPPVTSHPAGLVLRQPLPIGVFTSALDQAAPDPRKVTELYTLADNPRGLSPPTKMETA